MSQKTLISLLMIASLSASSFAFAQGNPRSDERGDRGDARAEQHERPDGDRPESRGAGPQHAYYKGGYLAKADRQHQYVVDDWRGQGLRAPPRGYHWVQSGGDFVLAAVATGLIVDLLLAH